MLRRTKIVCTIGPATSSESALRELIRNGMDVARINFSHGTWEEHETNIRALRRLADEEGRPLAILQDLQGPRIRVGQMSDPPVFLRTGQAVTLTSQRVVGTASVVPVSPPDLIPSLRPRARVLIADGEIELEVLTVTDDEAACQVLFGGPLSSHKGVNVPGVTLNIPPLTDKDIRDLELGARLGVDFVGFSFVRRAADILDLKRRLTALGSQALVISKIEKHEAVAVFDDLLAASDGIMVARGDLGVETSAEEVPIIQKMVIRKCNEVGKPVITATQMLSSMIDNPRPTRAEASDVANAIFDGTDAVMLSGETAIGKFPILALRTMALIATRADAALPYPDFLRRILEHRAETITDAISQATVEVADELGARAIVSLTESGHTARMVAKHRPRVPILATTPRQLTRQQLALTWGVQPLCIPRQVSTDEMIRLSVEAASAAGAVALGDLVVLTAGVPLGGFGKTNLLKVHVVGEESGYSS